jgi:fructokinase
VGSAAESADGAVVAIDAGKSKFMVGVFTGSLVEVERHRIPVTTVGDTLAVLEEHLASIFECHAVTSIGLSVFGPVGTDPGLPDFGAIIASSEPRWSGVNLPKTLAARFRVPVHFDFDVNTAVLAEGRCRASGSAGFIYVSIGTGIGGAFFNPAPGAASPLADPPQLGHVHLAREADDVYAGSCRFHGGCFQGLASGRAIFGRWGVEACDLPVDHEAWDLQARYIARACINLVYSTPFTTIRIGSGISQVPGLITRSNDYLRIFANGFPETLWREISGGGVIEHAVTAPDSSLVGAAIQAIEKRGLKFAHR